MSPVFSQVKVYDSFDTFQKEILESKDGKTHVVNFWATWCKPCVKELPYFEEIINRFDKDEVKVTLVSLDFLKQIDTKLIPFIKKNNIKSKVVLLNAGDPNAWIDKVDPEWSGAIPITLVFKDGKMYFYEREFENFEELKNIIE
jgi:thiol-disulfide isomerase/thioredoxin